ncbi:hypothetical protein DICPUDRAFT_57754 [Dictyostelium purpureum]|uniref:Bromo domain-containing protein n=1 Tax=Dictyostelium purpureum TaxID=5786 RepID=F0ZXH0_DICPU|nr:uncharacterized protein DICPUDRAFT_57754 [Dictyostelium purpureum]EGC31361.1 hypothetical protein DICPUDRAFT_57754 [Dictyostelium purpureum]|eukprot:XP_003292109.1 hypothetical protein DICPUDRAFT_57754 [Dictyostelium purpureum]
MGSLGFPVQNFSHPGTPHQNSFQYPVYNTGNPANLPVQSPINPLNQTPSKITPIRAAAVAATAAAQSQITDEIPVPEQKPGVTYQTCQHPLHQKWWFTSSILPISEFYPRASKCKKCYIKQQQDARRSRTQPGGQLPFEDAFATGGVTPIKNHLQPFLTSKPLGTPQTPTSLNLQPNHLTPHHMGGIPMGFTPQSIVPQPIVAQPIVPQQVSPFSLPHHLAGATTHPLQQTGMIGGIPSRQQNELLKQQYLLQQNQATLQHAQAQLLQAQQQAHFDDRELTPEERLARQTEVQKLWGKQGYTKQGYRPKQKPSKQFIRKEMFDHLKNYLSQLLKDPRSNAFRESADPTKLGLNSIEKRLNITIKEQQSYLVKKYLDFKQFDRDIRLVFSNAIQNNSEGSKVYEQAEELEIEYDEFYKNSLEEISNKVKYECEVLKFVCDHCKQPPISYQPPPTVDINGTIIQHEPTEVLPLLTCQGSCLRSFHLHCLGFPCTPEHSKQPYICRECIHGKPVLHFDPEENQYFYFYYEGINANQDAEEEYKSLSESPLSSTSTPTQIISDIGVLTKEDKIQLRKDEEEARLKEMYYDPYWCMWRCKSKITSKRDERQKSILQKSKELNLRKKVQKKKNPKRI